MVQAKTHGSSIESRHANADTGVPVVDGNTTSQIQQPHRLDDYANSTQAIVRHTFVTLSAPFCPSAPPTRGHSVSKATKTGRAGLDTFKLSSLVTRETLETARSRPSTTPTPVTSTSSVMARPLGRGPGPGLRPLPGIELGGFGLPRRGSASLLPRLRGRAGPMRG